MTSRQASLLTALGLAGLLAAVSLSAPRWAGLLRAPVGVFEEDEHEPAGRGFVAGGGAEAEAAAERRISVRLYFQAPDRNGLLPEEREVAFSGDLARQLRTVIEEIIRGPATGLLPTLSPQARVVEVFVTARGIAYVSLSKEATQDMPGGSKAELLTVYSLVNTVVANFPAVARVQLLVEDRPVDSFAGHIDVSRPLLPDMTLLALPSPSPVASASPTASPAP